MAENKVITRYRRQQLCAVTSGAVSSIPPVTQIAFGDGGTDTDGEPIPPTEEMTALRNKIAEYPIDGVTYPDTGIDVEGNEYPVYQTTARYQTTIPRSDLPGQVINEAALVDAEGNLCAVLSMYDKRKDDDVIFTFTFDDEF